MRILLDVMGGDYPPEELVKGGIHIGRRRGIEIVFAGDEKAIASTLVALGEPIGRSFHIIACTQVIEMDDSPVKAVRGKSDSSMIRGLKELKAGNVDAFVSPGNTGAVVAGSLFTLGRIAGIPRPGILAPLPTVEGRDIFLIDAGATSDCHAEHLLHFARMGATYATEVIGIENPTVGLLNIGGEQGKGNRLMARAYELLEAADLHFAGNVEAHQLIKNRPADVIVSDGFMGNICLKAIEGSVSAVTSLLKQSIRKSTIAKVGALLMRRAFGSLRSAVSYEKRGGAPLLGVNGIVVIAHGRSDAETIASAIDVACREVDADLTQKLSQSIARVDSNGS
ncbi:phosphate acyltransferase PlsX [Candidatus Bipolaricaulota bacterium]|nr:phosphate acyltransferase PlsX [Candidatus Bipolaricaulota bacterium]TFH11408.1 MAG: phosphate acyltransferase PlsX [Candidatus Atribacteria bacterium]